MADTRGTNSNQAERTLSPNATNSPSAARRSSATGATLWSAFTTSGS